MWFSWQKYCLAVLLLGCVWLGSGESWAGPERQTFFIGRNRVYQTPYYVFDSGQPGPRVLLQAGIHGDEVAGIYALEQILPRIRVHSGTLIIFPRMNPPAILINRRYYHMDLNRVFPGLPIYDPYEFALAREIYELVKNRRIEYVLTLHEARRLHNPSIAKSFGQTIVYGAEPPPRLIWGWLRDVNKHLDWREKFCHFYSPQEYGATDIMVERLRLKGGFAVETWRGFDLLRRIQMQELVVLTFLKQVGLDYSLK